jgi:hypothetical protein
MKPKFESVARVPGGLDCRVANMPHAIPLKVPQTGLSPSALGTTLRDAGLWMRRKMAGLRAEERRVGPPGRPSRIRTRRPQTRDRSPVPSILKPPAPPELKTAPPPSATCCAGRRVTNYKVRPQILPAFSIALLTPTEIN